MYKVKAHAEEMFLTGDMDALDYLGNLVADLAAGIIADDEVNTILDDDVSQWLGIAYQVANPISFIEKECYEMDPKEVPLEDDQDFPEVSVKQHSEEIISQVGAMNHTLVNRGRFLTCTKCATRVHVKDAKGKTRSKALAIFTDKECKPKGTEVSLIV